jgi:protein-tyrosine phosphatase
MGNICRSPTAEGVFRSLVESEARHLQIEIASAGTHAYHVGEPPDRRAQSAALSRGIDISGIRARRVMAEDFEYFDYVLAMDEDNLASLHELCPPERRSRVRLLLEYAPGLGVRNVPDPYYGSVNGFEYVLDLVEEASRGLLLEIARLARSA